MERKHLILFLNQLLANYFVMYVKCQRYKWFAKGEHIFGRQVLYEKISDAMTEEINTLAEHILSIDGKPFATMIKYLKVATIEEATSDDEDEEIIEELNKNFSQMSEEITEIGLKHADKVNDPLTKHLLLTHQQTLKMYIWRCRAYYN